MVTTTLDAATLEKLISAAVAAPSQHNTQPWRYRLDPDTTTIEVRATPGRGLRHSDPIGRGLHVSVGAAVFNLRVAATHLGWEPVVRLLPQPAEPGLLAAVRLAGPRFVGRRHRPDLYDALWRRHSSRFPFTGSPVPPEVLAEIGEAATAEGACLAFPDAAETSRVLHLTSEAERYDAADPGRSQETRSWVREGSPDGVPGAALGPHDATGHVPVRDFAGLRPGTRPRSAHFEPHPVIGVLSTAHDTRADWLRAGQGLQHALLVATAHHVRTSLFSQAVEWPDLRWALRDPRAGHQHVQMLIRFGYGPDGPATPRRPARDVLDAGGEACA
ncbi:MAG: hypothetical protein HOY69_04590 [Streptomyces sp.]|nr:hypothetical protein [Streptomyces sp.]